MRSLRFVTTGSDPDSGVAEGVFRIAYAVRHARRDDAGRSGDPGGDAGLVRQACGASGCAPREPRAGRERCGEWHG
jgi:hypothetical protein